MFCTKCGRQLHDEDIFCAHCGTKVREDLLREKTERREKREEIVFNPPFRAEAERRTKQISEEFNSHNSEPKKETVHFDWNLDGFPARETRREEKFELNWDDVIERKRTPGPVTVERIIPENAKNDEEQKEEPKETVSTNEEIRIFEQESKADKEELSIEDLERELFGEEASDGSDDPGFTIKYNRKDLEKDKDLQFNTYNAKKDAFQELLDKERARIESMENQRRSQWEEITNNEILNNREVKTPPEFEEIFIEPKTPLVPPLKEVGVVLPPLPVAVMAEEEPKEDADKTEDYKEEAVIAAIAEIKEEPAAEEPVAEEPIAEEAVAEEPIEEEAAAEEPVAEESAAEEKNEEEPQPPFQENDEKSGTSEEEQEKTKLRFSDVFPADTFESGDDDHNGSDAAAADSQKEIEDDDDDDDEEGYKGNKIIKALIIILAIIVAVELVIIGVKAIAPDSGFSKGVDSIMEKVTALLTGEEKPEDEPLEVSKSNYIEEYINMFSSEAGNIGSISHDASLKYDLSKTYAFENIGQTKEFENSAWDESDETMSKTYGHSIISNVISYYNGWKDRNEDSSLVGVNTLEIGEIRTAADGYYVLNRVTYAAADGETVVKYETVHLKPTAEDVVVDEIKEETV